MHSDYRLPRVFPAAAVTLRLGFNRQRARTVVTPIRKSGVHLYGMCHWLLAGIAVCGFAGDASADAITFGGIITQSVEDGTGPAVNNPQLNKIQDGDAYTISLSFIGSIASPGTYTLTGAGLTFCDPAAPTSETNFGFTSLTVTQDGSFDDISLLGCLLTGSGCFLGNQLAANFMVPSTGLNSQNISAEPILTLFPPIDLLEDDGIADIHGSVDSYSYTHVRAASSPEPCPLLCSVSALALIFLRWLTLQNGDYTLYRREAYGNTKQNRRRR